jgi:hypothetical protein
VDLWEAADADWQLAVSIMSKAALATDGRQVVLLSVKKFGLPPQMYYMKIWGYRPKRPTVWQPHASRCMSVHLMLKQFLKT